MAIVQDLVRILGFRSASPENPRFNLNDPQAWDAFAGGSSASSGVAVNPSTAKNFSPWWRGINLLSADLAKLPLVVYRLTDDGKGKSTDPEHPAYRLLRRMPNEFMPAFLFKQTLTAHAIELGNGYAWINRDPVGVPVELVPIDPSIVTPARENGRLLYLINVGAETRKVDARDVLHIRGLSYDGLSGYSVYTVAREALGLGLGAQKYGSIFFRNNARPSVSIEVPGRLNEIQIQSLRENWEHLNAGLDNAHRVAVLQGGAKVSPFSVVAKDAQLLETREFQVRDVANYLGVPPNEVGDSSRTSYNSLEQENQNYLDKGLSPWLIRWEEECWSKLLTDQEQADESHEILFQTRRLIRADTSAKAGYYATAGGRKPWMTANEIREAEDMDPIDGGDELSEPAPTPPPPSPLDQPAQPPPPPTPTPRPGKKKKESGQVEEMDQAEEEDPAVRVLVRVWGAAARRAARKPKVFTGWLASRREAWLDEARTCLVHEQAAALVERVASRLEEVEQTHTESTLAAGVEAAVLALEKGD